jgi:dTMP kinase
VGGTGGVRHRHGCLIAITALADRLGGDYAGASIGLVLAARIVPGFFLAPLAGVLVDRWDRKRLMVVCDLGRAAVLASLPFVDTIAGLVVASLLLEVFTLLWAPRKACPAPRGGIWHTANSLSLAAYGVPHRCGVATPSLGAGST